MATAPVLGKVRAAKVRSSSSCHGLHAACQRVTCLACRRRGEEAAADVRASLGKGCSGSIEVLQADLGSLKQVGEAGGGGKRGGGQRGVRRLLGW